MNGEHKCKLTACPPDEWFERARRLIIALVGQDAVCYYCVHKDEPKDKRGDACYYHCTSGGRSAFVPVAHIIPPRPGLRGVRP